MNNALGAIATAQRQSQVEEQVTRLDSVLNDIDSELSILSGKLSCVTREQNTGQTAVPMPPKEVLVPLANRVRDQYERAVAIRSAISSMRERLEV